VPGLSDLANLEELTGVEKLWFADHYDGPVDGLASFRDREYWYSAVWDDGEASTPTSHACSSSTNSPRRKQLPSGLTTEDSCTTSVVPAAFTAHLARRILCRLLMLTLGAKRTVHGMLGPITLTLALLAGSAMAATSLQR
jgi:hypothetical protein